MSTAIWNIERAIRAALRIGVPADTIRETVERVIKEES